MLNLSTPISGFGPTFSGLQGCIPLQLICHMLILGGQGPASHEVTFTSLGKNDNQKYSALLGVNIYSVGGYKLHLLFFFLI